jgi:hypothetical protein
MPNRVFKRAFKNSWHRIDLAGSSFKKPLQLKKNHRPGQKFA